MSRYKEAGEVICAIISLVNNQYSFLIELLGVLTLLFVRTRLVKKRLLLLMSSDFKMQNGKKRSIRSSPPYWVRSHRNLKRWNDFVNGNLIPEEWKENYRMSERSFYILCQELRPCSQR